VGFLISCEKPIQADLTVNTMFRSCFYPKNLKSKLSATSPQFWVQVFPQFLTQVFPYILGFFPLKKVSFVKGVDQKIREK